MKIENTHSLFRQIRPIMMAGPCSLESEEQILTIAKKLAADERISVLRAGIWKPRTRPNTFEGLGEMALPWLLNAKKATGLLTATEVATPKHVELCLKHEVDILWIGARTTVNPFSVQEIADSLRGVNIPVMIKNPINADLQLWVGAFERLSMAGIKKLIAIHRGFSVGQKLEFRNDPLWRIPIELKTKFPELLMICDPSHITGDRKLVHQVSQKAMDLNFDGLMIETHLNPDKAWSDASQQITPTELFALLDHLIIKNEQCSSKGFETNLEHYRSQIDRIDHEILEALKLRKSIVEKIAFEKVEQNITALQRRRFESLLKARLHQATTLNLDETMVKEIFDLIHENSVKIQTDIFDSKIN